MHIYRSTVVLFTPVNHELLVRSSALRNPNRNESSRYASSFEVVHSVDRNRTLVEIKRFNEPIMVPNQNVSTLFSLFFDSDAATTNALTVLTKLALDSVALIIISPSTKTFLSFSVQVGMAQQNFVKVFVVPSDCTLDGVSIVWTALVELLF